MKLEEFLKFEEEHDLLKYKFANSGYCIWPFIRYQVASYLVMGQNSSISTSNDTSFQSRSSFYIAMSLAKEYILSFFPRKKNGRVKKSRIIFFTSDKSDVPSKEGWYNRNLDVFAECNKDSSQIILHSDSTERYPRKFENYYYDVRNNVNNKLMSHIRRTSSIDKNTIDLLIAELEQAFPSIKDYLQGRIRSILYNKSRSLDFERKHYNKIIDKAKPEFAIVEDACYGYDKAYIIKLLKDKGIKVLEAQHSIVGPYNPAYNYSYSKDSEYAEYMPDIFMSYGEYWEKRLHIPVRIIPVGNPNFYKNASTKKEIKGRILIALSSDTSYWVEFIRDYISDNNEVDIVIKSHPLITEILKDFDEFNEIKGIELVSKGNIYDYLSEAEYVMSDKSTVLLEAYCMKKTVFVYDCEQAKEVIPNEVGFRFKTYEDFKSIIDSTKDGNGVTEEDVKFFFDSNWESNYLQIIQ